MAFARKWMQLEIIMLHKTSQTQKYKRDIFFSYKEFDYYQHLSI